MRKSILLAMIMVAFVAMPAFASVQNIKISGGVDSYWAYREDFDFGYEATTIGGDKIQNIFFTITSLQVDADLTDNVTATIALVNERAWGNDTDATRGLSNSGAQTDVEIDLAFVTLREMLYSPLTLVIGRQRLPKYGNGLIVSKGTGVGNSNLTDVVQDYRGIKAMDAIRAILDYDPLTVEIIYGKFDSNTVAGASEEDDDVDLYGIQTAYELGDDMNTLVEAYFWAKINKETTQAAANCDLKPDTVYTPGLRASTTPIEGLTVSGEIAMQSGTKVISTARDAENQKRKAMAAEFMATYQVPVAEDYNPVVSYDYIYASGDSNPADETSSGEVSRNKWTAWDPMLEGTLGGSKIFNALFSLTNVHVHSFSLQANPMEDVTSKVVFSKYWLDKETDGTAWTLNRTDTSGAEVVGAQDDETDLGYAVDLYTTYDYTEDVSIGALMSWFVPGDVFSKDNQDAASQVMVDVNVDF
ncbi:MAG: alginate export family protein [Candidatus Omnitrophica bacterium]|nr:alginate export family protein [Candidatus Omnitrophota bacterium]